MMALLSDVHGNLAALEAVLQRIDELGMETIYCLGDTAGYYPDVDGCCDALREHDVRSVRGNHDHYLVSGTRSGRSRYADLCMDQQQTTVTERSRHWLSGLPVRDRFKAVSVVHGGWRDPLEDFAIERVAYDVDRTRAAAAAAGLPPVVAANLDRGLVIGAP